LPLADDYREFLDKNLSLLPESCREEIGKHLRHEQHFRDRFFEVVVGRTLQVLGAEFEYEPVNPVDGSKVDFVATFSDGTVFVEAVSPVLDKEFRAILDREAPLTRLIQENVPPGWAAHIRALPNVGPDEPKRQIKAFLQREMKLPPPASDDDEIEISESFEQGDLRVILFPQSRHGLRSETKIAIGNVMAFWPNDQAALRGAVKRKYRKLRNWDGTSLVALNMTSTTASREDLDQALFGTWVTQFDQYGNEGGYFDGDGFFAGGEGEPAISGVLAFPEVGPRRCDDPILCVHPRFGGEFPRALKDLETRCAPDTEREVRVRQAPKTGLLKNLGVVESR
jgi:hypothetical protein